MSVRQRGHLIGFLLAVGLVALLTSKFVGDNLGGDFIVYEEGPGGVDRASHKLGSIALIFVLMSVPAALLAACCWEVVRWIGMVLSFAWKGR